MAKIKANKQTKGKAPLWGLPWFVWLIIALGIVGIVAFIRTSPTSEPAESSDTGKLKAVIIDQLYSLQPNEAFIHQMSQELRAYGFEVDLYQGDEVTVDFYRQLPGHGYKLIIFRAHSGLLGSQEEIIKRTCLFTNEHYSRTKHVTEQLGDQLAMARIDENHPWVFGIGAKFVTQSMEGRFPNTVIVMMGCSCLYLDDLAEAFIQKGASTYIGWDASVGLNYVDEATPILVINLCTKGMTIKEAVDKTMADVGPDPDHHASLKYYPIQTGKKAIDELIR